METIILILVIIGSLSLTIMTINNIITNTRIEKNYDIIIKFQNEIVENNKTITNNINLLKEHFNKNITDIAKTFNFYDRRIIHLEERHYKRKKKIDKEVDTNNTNNVQ